MKSPRRSVHALAWRQLRVPTLVMALVTLSMERAGVSAYTSSGGAKGMAGIMVMLKDPAIVALYGRVSSMSVAGSFVMWKMGMFLALAIALWGVLMATRLFREAEDVGTWDMVAVGQLGRSQVSSMVTAVIFEAGVVLGVASWIGFTGAGRPSQALAAGLAMTGIAWWGGVIGLVASQVRAPRRSATQAGLAVVAVLFLLRMIGDATTALSWLRMTSPFGWLESAQVFNSPQDTWLACLLAAPLGIVVARSLERTRDVGGAKWASPDRGSATSRSTSSPLRFAWRERRSTVVSWSVGLGLFGLVLGYLANALVHYSEQDPNYVTLLRRWDLGAMTSATGFVSEIGVITAVGVAFAAVSLVSTLASEMTAGRLDLPLAYGVSRRRWALAGVATNVAGMTLAVSVMAFTMWVGVRASGTPMLLSTTFAAVANATTVVPLVMGLATLAVVWRPRFAYVIMAALLALFYLVAMFGTALHWPQAVVDVSPFHYLHAAPLEHSNWPATWWFLLAGVLLSSVGLWWFERRDLGA